MSLIRENEKKSSERKWTYREYHVQDNAYVSHKDVKMYCKTNQFSGLTFFVTHSKPHGARGSSKHYHLSFYPKLCNDVCETCRIRCACITCTSMLEKPWISSIPLKKNTSINLSPNETIGQY